MRRKALYGTKLLIVGLAVLALNACSSTPAKMYSGPALPADQTAIVRSGAYTDIVSIDGAGVSGTKITVLPGKHTLEMKPHEQIDSAYNYYAPGNYFFYSNVNGRVDFTAEPGRTYQVYANMTAGPHTGGYGTENDVEYGTHLATGFTWTGYVVDETAHKRVARTDTLPLEAYPRSYSAGGHAVFR